MSGLSLVAGVAAWSVGALGCSVLAALGSYQASPGGDASAGGAPSGLLARIDGGGPRGIGVDSTNVYWADTINDAIDSAPKDPRAAGAGAVFAVVPDAGAPEDLVVDGEYVYWVEEGTPTPGVDRADHQGGQRAQLFGGAQGADPTQPGGLAGDSLDVWFAGVGFGGGLFLVQIPKDGSPPRVASGGQLTDGRVTSDGSSKVFWASASAQAIYEADIGVLQESLFIASVAPTDLAADGTNLYWISGGSILYTSESAPPDGGPFPALASGAFAPVRLALDATHVYFTNAGTTGFCDGTIVSVAKDTGLLVTLATGQCNPFGIVVDATNVYWTNFDDGTVMTAPLP